MVKFKPRLSEGDISLILRRGHRPLIETKSLPVRPIRSDRENNPEINPPPVSKILKETIGQIVESEKEVEYAAREVEHIIRKERRAIEEFEKNVGEDRKASSMGSFTRWMHLKRETVRNNQAAKADMRRASEAMKAAEEKITLIEDRLEEEERQLQARALALRRKSEDVFKLVDHRAMIARAEKQRCTEDGDLRFCEATSL